MSITLTSTLTPIWFTPQSQIDVDQPAEFKLKPLSGQQMLEVLCGPTPDLMLAIQHGLKDWKGIQDTHGKALPFKLSKASMLPALLLSELANEIISLSQLGETDTKNS